MGLATELDDLTVGAFAGRPRGRGGKPKGGGRGQSGGGQKPAAQGALGAAFAKAFEDKNKRG